MQLSKQKWNKYDNTFSIEDEKFQQLLFFTANMMFINLLVNTLHVEF